MKHCLKQRNKSTCFYVKVSDEWYPNFKDNTVCVSWHWKEGRISVWGDDDFGMEKEGCTKEEFLKMKTMVLNKELCKKMGFVYA